MAQSVQFLIVMVILIKFLIQPTTIMASSTNNTLKDTISSFVSQFPYLKHLLKQEEKNVSIDVKGIINQGFTSLSRSVSLQAFERVDPNLYDEFVAYALQVLAISNSLKARIKAEVFDFLPFSDGNDWKLYRVLFSDKGSKSTHYVSILARNNDEMGFDFVFATFDMTFELAPNIIVLTQTSSRSYIFGAIRTYHSSTRIVRIPNSIRQQDIDALLLYFDIVTFTRFAKLVNILIPGLSRERRSPKLALARVLMNGFDMFDIFKTKYESKLVKRIIGKGFAYFYHSSAVHYLEGLPAEYLDVYLLMTPSLYNIPKKYLHYFYNIFLLAKFSNSQKWTKHDFLFDNGDSFGTNTWMTLLLNRDVNGKYNILVVTIDQKFKLAPHILIIQNSVSLFGGIFQISTIQQIATPRFFTEEDKNFLFQFFDIIALKKAAEFLGIKSLPFPNLVE